MIRLIALGSPPQPPILLHSVLITELIPQQTFTGAAGMETEASMSLSAYCTNGMEKTEQRRKEGRKRESRPVIQNENLVNN